MQKIERKVLYSSSNFTVFEDGHYTAVAHIFLKNRVIATFSKTDTIIPDGVHMYVCKNNIGKHTITICFSYGDISVEACHFMTNAEVTDETADESGESAAKLGREIVRELMDGVLAIEKYFNTFI